MLQHHQHEKGIGFGAVLLCLSPGRALPVLQVAPVGMPGGREAFLTSAQVPAAPALPLHTRPAPSIMRVYRIVVQVLHTRPCIRNPAPALLHLACMSHRG